MNEMVERARRAFGDAIIKTPAWEHMKKCNVDDIRTAMRAAIAAMREPTQEMLDAVSDDHCWRQMIDAALADKPV